MRRVGLVALLVLAASQQGCEPDDPPGGPPPDGTGELKVLASQAATLGIPRVKTDRPFTVGWANVCVDGNGPVAIRDVRPVNATNATVLDFALRDSPTWPDGDTFEQGDVELDWRVGLADAGFDPTAKSASLQCEEGSARAHQLGIELATSTPGVPGVVESFEVRWGDESEAVPLRVVLCPFEDAADPRCQPKD